MRERRMKREMIWHIDGTEYKVLNVPMCELHAEEEEYVDLDIALKLGMIRDLMVANDIPPLVDFDEVVDLVF